LAQLQQYQLEAVIHSPQQIALLQARKTQQMLTVWLKMDSGMNRLGFKAADFQAAYQSLLQCPSVNQPIHLITHFASADDLQDSKTQEQLALFNAATKDYPGQRSIANSAGIIGWPQAISDWVRPGIMLFGCSPFADKTATDLGLKPVMSLHSRVIAVKQLEAGETVGYSGTWRAEQPTRLGVVAVGYGDGYPRYAKTGTPVLVNGQRVPLIGRVSMDMITVDLNQLPDVQPGDPVTLWGDGLAVEEIAHYADTIPYTLLCGITPRVQMIDSA
jgi:alanine racemase